MARKVTAPAARPAATPTGGGVVDRARYQYIAHPEVRTGSGRAAVDCGDVLADALRGKTLEQVVGIANENDIFPGAAFENRNPGMVRMALGNRLRAKLRKEGRLKVGGRWLKSEAVAAVETEAAADIPRIPRKRAAAPATA